MISVQICPGQDGRQEIGIPLASEKGNRSKEHFKDRSIRQISKFEFTFQYRI